MPADCPPSVGPCPPSPLGLGLGVDTPRCDDHAWCLLRSSGSLGSLQTAASAPSIPAPATDSLRAAIRKLDASLPLAGECTGPACATSLIQRMLGAAWRWGDPTTTTPMQRGRPLVTTSLG